MRQRPIDPVRAREASLHRERLHAAPPDDGHAGAFTMPEDTMEVTGPEGESEPSPPLHVDPTRTGTIDRVLPHAGLGVATGTIFLIALVAAAIVAVLLVVGG